MHAKVKESSVMVSYALAIHIFIVYTFFWGFVIIFEI